MHQSVPPVLWSKRHQTEFAARRPLGILTLSGFLT
jgi:hypothetical protein